MTQKSGDELPTVVDLFCGAGGLSSGLERAGWHSVALVDHDADSIRTLRSTQERRIPIPEFRRRSFLAGSRLIHDDITRVTADAVRPVGAGTRWRPDLLAGGPPCQPFSSAGLRRGLEDPRGQLFLEFVRLADELRPRFILFENVAGLVTARTPGGEPGEVLELVQKSFESLRYACRFALLNSADYGAPQRRVRLFMLASRDERLPEFPSPTHSATAMLGATANRPWVTLAEFLAKQPEPAPDEVVRPTARRLHELAKLEPGTGLRSGGIVEANRPSGHWGYRQDCFLADPNLPSRTIRAASTPDWIRLGDTSLRRLTWKECAGLQGFPAEWAFEGNASSRFRQIGNAVQGDVAKAIGEMVFEAARERRRAKPTSVDWPPSFHRRVRYTKMEELVNGAHRSAARQARAS